MMKDDIRLIASLRALEAKIDQLISAVKIRELKDKDLLLDNADFVQLFKISSKTAQNWRDEGLIEYSQVKGKIYYRLKDIREFINRHRKSRKR